MGNTAARPVRDFRAEKQLELVTTNISQNPLAPPWPLATVNLSNAGWSSLVARQAHNLKVAGSNPAPATTLKLFEVPLNQRFAPR